MAENSKSTLDQKITMKGANNSTTNLVMDTNTMRQVSEEELKKQSGEVKFMNRIEENNNDSKEISNSKSVQKNKDLFGDVSDFVVDNKSKTLETNSEKEKKMKRVFGAFLLANIFLNYDTGVIPASLLEIVKEVKLDFKEQALMGSLVYLGLSFASLFVSLIFNKYGPAKVCGCVLIINTICCFIFSFTRVKYILFACRFVMGVSEAFVVIYGPVWVNNYSPPEHSAKWMGILHSCSALGVMAGYLVAGITINFLSDFLTWRFAIQVQGLAQIPIALYFWFEDETYINVEDKLINPNENLEESIINDTINENPPNSHNNTSKMVNEFKSQISITNRQDKDQDMMNNNNREQPSVNRSSAVRRKDQPPLIRKTTRMDTIETSNLARYCSQASVVTCNALYISVTLGLCSMFFIVTGIQFWMTSYLIDILGNNPVHVVIIFSTVSITAPLAGVIVGGTFADKYGGYRGKNTLKALKLCIAFGVVAFVFAFPLGFLTSLIYITVLLWTFLFFGAAIVPVGTGIMVSSVRKDCQATSSSISQLIFNFLGYFSAPILTGFIMDSFKDKHEGYKWGMRLIFWWAIFAVIFMGLAWIVAYNKFKKGYKEEQDLIEDEMNQNMGDLVKLEIMRRMAQNNV